MPPGALSRRFDVHLEIAKSPGALSRVIQKTLSRVRPCPGGTAPTAILSELHKQQKKLSPEPGPRHSRPTGPRPMHSRAAGPLAVRPRPARPLDSFFRRTQAHRSPARTPQVHPFTALEDHQGPGTTSTTYGPPCGCYFLIPGATTPEKGYGASGRLTAHLGFKIFKKVFSSSKRKPINPLWCPKALCLMRALVVLESRAWYYI